MAEWLGWASQEHDMYCHDLEVIGSKPGQVELWVRSRAGTVYRNTDNITVCLLKNGYRFLPLLPKVIVNVL